MFKGTMTKCPVQKLTQGTTKNSYNIMTQQIFRKHIFLWFSDFSFFIFFFIDNFLKEFSILDSLCKFQKYFVYAQILTPPLDFMPLQTYE